MILGFQTQFRKPILAGTKIHSLREDAGGRWRRGRRIHMAINVRTKAQRQFKVTDCTAIQLVELEWRPELFLNLIIRVGGRQLTQAEATVFARNDGFKDVTDLFQFFKSGFKKTHGVIRKRLIHWTEYRY